MKKFTLSTTGIVGIVSSIVGLVLSIVMLKKHSGSKKYKIFTAVAAGVLVANVGLELEKSFKPVADEPEEEEE